MKKRILAIDDDELMLLTLEAFLIGKGFQVLKISQEQLIEAAISDFKPELIILDIRLINSDGRDICDELKSRASTSYIPIILLTALDYNEISRIDCKADAIIGKPFESGSLLSTIHQLLNS